MTRIVDDTPKDPGVPNVLIPKTEAERDAMLAGARPIDPRLADMRKRSAPLQALLDDWGFLSVPDDAQDACRNLLRGFEFGTKVSDVKPILVHKARYDDTLAEATVTQPHVLSLVTNIANDESGIYYGYLYDIQPVTQLALDSRGLTSFDPETGHPLREIKRNSKGRVIYNYEWHVVAVRPVTEEDVEDEGQLDELCHVIGEAFADLLVDPVEMPAEAPAVKPGMIDYSKVSFLSR